MAAARLVTFCSKLLSHKER